MRFFDGPDIEEWAESSFFSFVLPQAPHFGLSWDPEMSISLVFPQSSHK
jgi:hypothetical protein